MEFPLVPTNSVEIPFDDITVTSTPAGLAPQRKGGDTEEDGEKKRVFLGRLHNTNVAVKIFTSFDLDMERLHNEVTIMAQTPHQHIVRFMGACTMPGHVKIVTELWEGDLRTLLLSNNTELPLTQRMLMAYQVAMGMNWLHQADPRIAHNNLCLSNVLYRRNETDPSVCLSNFGSAEKIPSKEAVSANKLPEALKKDVVDFGALLWELSACKPFPSKTETGTDSGSVAHQLTLPDSCPPSLHQLISRCCSANTAPTDGVWPSFDYILSALKNVIIDTAIQDPGARKFWTDHFAKSRFRRYIDFDVFVRAFLKVQEKTSLGNFNLHCATTDPTQIAVRILFNFFAQKLSTDGNPVVDLVRFGRVMAWVGPFGTAQHPDQVSEDFAANNALNRMRQLCALRFFHGDIDHEEAANRLGASVPGRYLLRFGSKPGVWTIVRVSQDGTKGRTAVYCTSAGLTLINPTTTSAPKYYSSWDELIEREAESHGWEKPRGHSPFNIDALSAAEQVPEYESTSTKSKDKKKVK
eukprot:TRINITY_DN4021_c0_g1_i1.p1 TRINITY_DN4021_c0_g1~~TRINITY_DN4021_c0_g1_i1.p1  ORF type:complete len:532 (+),score=80.70 TRINITY_DN4021_c0_g1_i1:29-1597(+)